MILHICVIQSGHIISNGVIKLKGKSGKKLGAVIAFIVCLSITFASVLLASYIESDFGRVDVSQVRIPIITNNGINTYVTAKLYIPKGVN